MTIKIMAAKGDKKTFYNQACEIRSHVEIRGDHGTSLTPSLMLLGFQTGKGYEVGRQCEVFLHRADIEGQTRTHKHYLGNVSFSRPQFIFGF